MKITSINKDIFELQKKYPDSWIMNPVNLVGVMGKGLAKEMKERFPGHFECYRKLLASGELIKLGFGFDNVNNIILIATKQH